MKKALLLVTLVFSTLFSIKLSAQYCGNSSPSICTPGSGYTAEGFYPPQDSFPCAIVGVPFDTVINVHTPAVATQGTSSYPLQYIILDTLANLPCGLCWSTGSSTNRIDGNSTGCVRFKGTTFDAPGLYLIRIIVAATVTVFGLPITESNQNLSSQGLHFFIRVRLPGDTCIRLDTLSPGLPCHTIGGTIGAPVITGSTALCPGGSTTLSATGTGYYAYTWSNGTFGSSISVSTPGAYSVTVYGNCASATASVNVTNATITTPTVTANGPVTFCQGSNVVLNAGVGYSAYAWSNGAVSQTINVTQTGNYTCTVSESGCPTVSNTTAVTVNASPSPTVTAGGTTTLCGGDSVQLNAGSGYAAYAWSTSETTQTIEAKQTGTYVCTVTQNGCNGTSNSISVTANSPAPTLTSSGPLVSCTGGIDTLDAGAGFASYAWSTNAITRTIVVTQSGNYTCTVTQGGCQGVSNTVVISIGSSLNPVITATPSLTICTGATATLDAGSGYGTYTWSTTSSNETISATTSNTYTVTVTQGACSGTASATLNVGSFPLTVNVTPPGPVSVCAGTPVSLDAGAGYSGYSWSNGNTSETIQPTTSGSYIITVTKNFCTGNATVNVNFNAPPQPVVTSQGPLSTCVGNIVTLDAGAGFASYNWSNGSNTETSQVSTADTYVVTVVDNNTCSGTGSVAVSFGTPPVPVITATGGGCTGLAATLSAGAGYSSYLWTTGDTTASIAVSANGVYDVTVTQNGCSGQPLIPYTFTFVGIPAEHAAVYLDVNGNAVVQVSPTGAGYSWLSQQTPGGSYTAESDVTQSFLTNCISTPVYFTAVVNQGGCNDTSSAVEVVCTNTGIKDIPSLVNFSAQPNPASDVLFVNYQLSKATPLQISVIDLTGRRVMDVMNGTESRGEHKHEVKLNQLASGMYLLNFMTDKDSFNTKFVKQ